MILNLLIVVLLGVPTTLLANRLLGLRRGWLELLLAGILGWTAGLLFAGSLGDWSYGSWAVVLNTVVLSLLLTMVFIVGLDLLAPRGSLARGDQAGLFVVPHPLRDLGNSVSFWPRYWQLLSLARKHGLRRGVVRQAADGTPVTDGGTPVALRRTIEDAGGMFIKLGQVASTRDDILPYEICEELAKLQSAVPPAPRSEMQRVVETELGASVDVAFSEFEWEPIAAGSIAHAYRAKLVDGSSVIVKVQRPGLHELFERDRRALLATARLLERRTPLGLSVSPVAMATEFTAGLADELDFAIEANNAHALQLATPDDLPVTIPRVHHDLSTGTVIVQDELLGSSIADETSFASGTIDRAELARNFLRVYFHHVFDEGIFHADPHPGNIFVLNDGTIGLIDLGSVGRLTPTQRNAMLSMLLGLATNDVETIRQAVEEIGAFQEEVSAHELERAIGSLLAQRLAPGMKIGVDTVTELVSLLGEFRITFQPELTLLMRALLSFEGSLRVIDPEFDIFAEARLVATDKVSSALHLDGLKTLVTREAAAQFPRLRRLPGRIDTVLEQLTTGRLEARVSFLRSEQDVRIVKSLVNRVVLGLVATMLGLGSVLLLGVPSGPMLGDAVALNDVLGYVGLVSAGVLTLRVVGEIVREGLN